MIRPVSLDGLFCAVYGAIIHDHDLLLQTLDELDGPDPVQDQVDRFFFVVGGNNNG